MRATSAKYNIWGAYLSAQNMVEWGIPEKALRSVGFGSIGPPSQKLRQILFLPDFPHEIKIGRWGGPVLRNSAQRVPEPDLLPSISLDTRPDSVLEIIG